MLFGIDTSGGMTGHTCSPQSSWDSDVNKSKHEVACYSRNGLFSPDNPGLPIRYQPRMSHCKRLPHLSAHLGLGPMVSKAGGLVDTGTQRKNHCPRWGSTQQRWWSAALPVHSGRVLEPRKACISQEAQGNKNSFLLPGPNWTNQTQALVSCSDVRWPVKIC